MSSETHTGPVDAGPVPEAPTGGDIDSEVDGQNLGEDLDEHINPIGRPPWAAALVALACILVAILGAGWMLGDVLDSADKLTERISIPVGIRLDASGAMFVQTSSCADPIQEVTVAPVADGNVSGPASTVSEDGAVFHAWFPGSGAPVGGSDDVESPGLFRPGLDAESVLISRESAEGMEVDVFDASALGVSDDGTGRADLAGGRPWAVQMTTKRGSGAAIVAIPADPVPGVYAGTDAKAIPRGEFAAFECTPLD